MARKLRDRRSRVTFQFFATPAKLKQQLLRDFEQSARRMRLMYIFRGENNEPHPHHVKSAWKPSIQRSVALESYLEVVKSDLAEIEITKPKNNLPPAEREALRALKRDTEINLKKADKRTITVVMNTQDKIKEGQILLDNQDNCSLLHHPWSLRQPIKLNNLLPTSTTGITETT